jgi:UDP-glucose 4-epimerase
MTYYFITGCAGFLGSNLAERLVRIKEDYVFGYDNFSTGKFQFIKELTKLPNFHYMNADIHDFDILKEMMGKPDVVFHLAANADVRRGFDHPYKDVDQNILSTFYVLEAMRQNGAKNIVFTSTGSIYGASTLYPTPECAPFPIQNSLYAASKLAGEGLIQAYCEGYDMKCWIYRLSSVMGKNYQHGCLFDFYKSLLKDNTKLNVLSDGYLQKSYVNIEDCLNAIGHGLENAKGNINIYNVAPDETCNVRDIVAWICEHLHIDPEINYGSERAGWKGDIKVDLSNKRIKGLGWRSHCSIKESVIQTLKFFEKNPWLFEEH